jgi:hypothetical protein
MSARTRKRVAARRYQLSTDERIVLTLYRSVDRVTQGLVVEALLGGRIVRNDDELADTVHTSDVVALRKASRANILAGSESKQKGSDHDE